MLASQITSLTVVYSIVYSGVNQRKHQSSASLAFVREIHRGPVNFPHKWPVTRKMFPFDDVIMCTIKCVCPALYRRTQPQLRYYLHVCVGIRQFMNCDFFKWWINIQRNHTWGFYYICIYIYMCLYRLLFYVAKS